MIRAIILGTLALVVAFIFSLFVSVPSFAAGLHPRCNIDWPCAPVVKTGKNSDLVARARRQPDRMLISSTSFEAAKINTTRAERREARRIARGQRLQQAMPFGAPIVPPETQRSFLSKSSGLVAPLAAKLASIQSACPGTVVISGVRHTYIAGTRRISLHASGKAVDVRGPYGCIYAQLRGWQGGYSTDAGRVRHIHISYDADGGREMGLAFRHGGGRKHARRDHRHRIADAAR